MSKTLFIESIAAKTGLSKTDAEKAFTAAMATITETLSVTGSIQITGLGSFKIVDTAPRQGRNPQTGEILEIPAGKRVKFSAAKALRDKLKADDEDEEQN